MAESNVRGQYTTHEWGVWGVLPQRPPAFRASKFAPKFIHTILVFEINKGRNAQKVKKILTIIYNYLLEEDSNGHMCGGVLPQKIIEI